MKKRIIGWMRNKYILAITLFMGWICFFNDIDLFYIVRSRYALHRLASDVDDMRTKTQETERSLKDLTTNSATLEKFARETYYMKKADEDVYVFKERAE
jgi:hypothetical protein